MQCIGHAASVLTKSCWACPAGRHEVPVQLRQPQFCEFVRVSCTCTISSCSASSPTTLLNGVNAASRMATGISESAELRGRRRPAASSRSHVCRLPPCHSPRTSRCTSGMALRICRKSSLVRTTSSFRSCNIKSCHLSKRNMIICNKGS